MNGPSGTPLLTEASTPLGTPVILTTGRPPTARGQSLAAMIAGSDAVAFVRVVDIALPYDPRPGYAGVPTEEAAEPGSEPSPGQKTPPTETSVPAQPLNVDPRKVASATPQPAQPAYATPSEEELSRPPGRLFTVYAVVVEEAVAGAASVGDTLYVGQVGGILGGVEYRAEGAPVLRVGVRYLLTLDREATVEKLAGRPGYFTGHALTLFEVSDDGTLRPLDAMWSYLPAVRELTGRTVDQASAMLAGAAAGPSP